MHPVAVASETLQRGHLVEVQRESVRLLALPATAFNQIE